jgi:hypothetical protein
MTLEQELIEIFASTPYQRNREILIGYYGWEDGRQHTLTEIGSRFGITRERVRQVCAKLTKRARSPDTVSPVMDRALALIIQRLPCPAAQLEAELVEQGLSAVGMSIESIAAGARLLGRSAPFQTVNVRDQKRGCSPEGRLVIRPDQLRAVLASVNLAKKEVYFHGLTTVQRIQRAISTRYGSRAGPDLARQTLPLLSGFCWLDEPTGWFRLRSVERHGLPRAIDKALAVAGSVSIGELRTALRRNRRLWKTPPPKNVLLEFCRQMPGVRIAGDRVIADPPRDWRKALTGVEAKLVALLKAQGPVMERGAMEDFCVAHGMNRFSFHAFVSWSPVIAQYGHSIYGLLGAEISEEQLSTVLAQRRANRAKRRVLDRHGWTDDGRVWLSYRLSKAASTYAVITIPAALKKVVTGRFRFLDGDGREIGTLATKDGRAWGLGAFLRKHSAKIGDQIVLSLDLERRTASVTWEEKGDADATVDEER